jgi:hypothetical protein
LDKPLSQVSVVNARRRNAECAAEVRARDSEQQLKTRRAAEKARHASDRQSTMLNTHSLDKTLLSPDVLTHVAVKLNIIANHHKHFVFISMDL